MEIQNPVHLFLNQPKTLPQSCDIVVIGSGMGSLSAAVILAKHGYHVCVLEQNYLPGGCSSSYARKGVIFESGATTLVGLDPGMPLAEVIRLAGVSFKARKLDIPMEIIFDGDKKLRRFSDLASWIKECESFFGGKSQAAFWTECQEISQFVWDVSRRQIQFPPERFTDLVSLVKSSKINDLRFAKYLRMNTFDLLKKHQLHEDNSFLRFVDEQLMITAQNKHTEVNALFGATALCYTLQGNYYVDGGMVQLVSAFVDTLRDLGSELHLKTKVNQIHRTSSGWTTRTSQGDIFSKFIISGLPVNNLTELLSRDDIQTLKLPRLLDSKKLNSAFQLGILFKRRKAFDLLHVQIHHDGLTDQVPAGSFFVSLSHPEDTLRCASDECVASVSFHLADPGNAQVDKEQLKTEVMKRLVELDFFSMEDVIYTHASDARDWESWTGRKFGFVGGYPQYHSIPVWKMNRSRAGQGLYLCGDSVYPGQGIPGVALGGRIAAEKLMADQ